MLGKKWAWVFCMARTSWHVETGTAVVGWYRRSAPACGAEHSCSTLLLPPSCATTPAIPSFWPLLYYNCSVVPPWPPCLVSLLQGSTMTPCPPLLTLQWTLVLMLAGCLLFFLWLFALVMVMCRCNLAVSFFSPKVLSPSADEELTGLSACSSDCWLDR